MPKVSIIVPIYNVEKYLDRCMESLLNQTLKDIEIIMVDDGSPDNCPKMCDEYAKKDNRVKVVHKQNAGLGFARNSGLEVATGEYVAFVDSDDFVECDMYEKLYEQVKKNQADTIYCGFRKYWSNDDIKEFRHVSNITIFEGKKLVDFSLDLVGSFEGIKKDWIYEMSVWHGLYSNKIIKKYSLGFHSEREVLSEDIVFQEQYLKYAKRVVYVPDTYYYYCFNNVGSLTHARYDSSKCTRMLKLFHLLCDLTRNNDSKCLRAQRFLLAYMRANSEIVVKSKFSHEKTIKCLEELNSKKIWSQIDYPIHTLAFHSYIIAFLQKHHIFNGLIAFLKLKQLVRNIVNS